MALPMRQLGRDGPLVNTVGFGCMSIGGAYSKANPRAENLELLDHAYAIGERFWDTADIYFDAEETIGEWLSKNPEKCDGVVIATKLAIQFDPKTWSQTIDNSRDYLRKCCERSLKKLQTDYIDLYCVHRIDGTIPIKRTIEALVELKNENKIRHIGLSEASAETLRRASKVHQIAAHQIEYNAFTLLPTELLLPVHRELGITTVAYSRMGRGFLTGNIKSLDDLPAADFRKNISKTSPENPQKALKLVEKFQRVAEAHGKTPAQMAVAWLLAQGDDIIAIPGTKSKGRLSENTAAGDVKLSDAEVKLLRDAAEATILPGSRTPDAWPIGGDTPPL